MKEATGELSTTVIAVVAIAAVLTIFTTILLPMLRQQIQARMHCSDAICTECKDDDAKCNCTYQKYKDDGSEDGNPISIKCQNPNYNSRKAG